MPCPSFRASSSPAEHEQSLRRSSLRSAPRPRATRLHRHRGALARPRHRRQHGGVQSRERHHVAENADGAARSRGRALHRARQDHALAAVLSRTTRISAHRRPACFSELSVSAVGSCRATWAITSRRLMGGARERRLLPADRTRAARSAGCSAARTTSRLARIPSSCCRYNYWQRAFAGDRGVVGTELRLSGPHYTIVGVAPKQIEGLLPGISRRVSCPIQMINQLEPTDQRRADARAAITRASLGATGRRTDASPRAQRSLDRFVERHAAPVPGSLVGADDDRVSFRCRRSPSARSSTASSSRRRRRSMIVVGARARSSRARISRASCSRRRATASARSPFVSRSARAGARWSGSSSWSRSSSRSLAACSAWCSRALGSRAAARRSSGSAADQSRRRRRRARAGVRHLGVGRRRRAVRPAPGAPGDAAERHRDDQERECRRDAGPPVHHAQRARRRADRDVAGAAGDRRALPAKLRRAIERRRGIRLRARGHGLDGDCRPTATTRRGAS